MNLFYSIMTFCGNTWLFFFSSSSFFIWVKMWAWVKEAKKPVGLFFMFQVWGLSVTEAEEFLAACGQDPFIIINRQFCLVHPFSLPPSGTYYSGRVVDQNYSIPNLGQIPHSFNKLLILLLLTELRPLFIYFS